MSFSRLEFVGVILFSECLISPRLTPLLASCDHRAVFLGWWFSASSRRRPYNRDFMSNNRLRGGMPAVYRALSVLVKAGSLVMILGNCMYVGWSRSTM